jgi:hypothetical protein
MPGFHRTTPTECILRPFVLPLAFVTCAVADVAYSLSEENIVALAHCLSRQVAGP